MRKIIVVLVGLMVLVSCEDWEREKNTVDAIQKQQTEQLVSEAQRQVGMPNIVNFQERKLMKTIFELRDKENLVCYAYIKSDYQGKLVFIGKCIGYGIPFSAQFTNPERPYRFYNGSAEGFSLPQPDPNGLFMPTSSSATWLMMIDPKDGKVHPVYLEPEIVVSPFPLPEH